MTEVLKTCPFCEYQVLQITLTCPHFGYYKNKYLQMCPHSDISKESIVKYRTFLPLNNVKCTHSFVRTSVFQAQHKWRQRKACVHERQRRLYAHQLSTFVALVDWLCLMLMEIKGLHLLSIHAKCVVKGCIHTSFASQCGCQSVDTTFARRIASKCTTECSCLQQTITFKGMTVSKSTQAASGRSSWPKLTCVPWSRSHHLRRRRTKE